MSADALTRYEAHAPTAEEAFYAAWGWQAVQSSIDLCNQVSRHLLTTTAALMGGGIVFLDKATLPAWSRWTAMAWLLAAFAAAFLGMLPFTGDVDPDNVSAFKRFTQRAGRYKRRLVWSAAGMLFMAFLFALLGLAVGKSP